MRHRQRGGAGIPRNVYKRLLLEKMFRQQNGKCYYCKQPMVLMPRGQNTGKLPDNAATVEHLIDRYDPRRNDPPRPGERRWRAACAKCNHERGSQRTKALGLEELRRRSGRGTQEKTNETT